MTKKIIYLVLLTVISGLVAFFVLPLVSAAGSLSYQTYIDLARKDVDKNRYGAALGYYNEALLQQPNNTDLLIEMGRVYGWSDRYNAAIRCYEKVIAVDPSRRDDVLVPLALQYLWSDRPRTAARLLQEFVSRHPENTDAQINLARAQYWAGVDELGLATLQKLPADQAIQAKPLLQVIKDNLDNNLNINYERSHDTDDLNTDIYGFNVTYHPTLTTSLIPQVRLAHLDQTGQVIDGRSFYLAFRDRFGGLDSGYGLLYPTIRLGERSYSGQGITPWDTTAWDAALKWLPADSWRVDFNAGNEIIENMPSIQNHVTYTSTSLGADYRYAPGATVSLGAGVGSFGDGNYRTQYVNRWLYNFSTVPSVTLGLEGIHYIDSDPSISRGYYNPADYTQGLILMNVRKELFGWVWQARVGWGQLWENPGLTGFLLVYRFSVGKTVPGFGSAEIYYGESGPTSIVAEANNTYRRNYGGIMLTKFL